MENEKDVNLIEQYLMYATYFGLEDSSYKKLNHIMMYHIEKYLKIRKKRMKKLSLNIKIQDIF